MSKDIQQQKQYNILLIGELCQDIYVFGEVNRLSPEAPVPVLKKIREEYKAGMAGNVYDNMQKMTGDVEIDFYCNEIQNIKKIRYIDEKSNYQIMRYDVEKSLYQLKFEDITKIDYDVVVISDYNKGYLSRAFIKQITTEFKNCKIFVDTKKKNISHFKNSIIKLNEAEARASIGLDASSDVIITLGSKGCQFNNITYPVKPVEVYDVCGAGDVFLAALVVRWLETKDIDSAIKTANNCAALSVTKLGCYTVTRKEYENLCV